MCENILGMIVASKPNLVDSNLCIIVSKPNLVDSNLHFIVSKPNLGRHRKRACVVTMHKEHICTCYTHTVSSCFPSVVMETLSVPRLRRLLWNIWLCAVSVPETVSFS